MTAPVPIIPRPEPPLADTLRLMMPDAPTTLLLQSALLPADRAAAAFSRWRQTTSDPKAFLASDRVGIKRHLPLLYRYLTASRIDIGRDLEPYFRAARAREELRRTRFARFLADALAALRNDDIDFVVGKGIAIGETVHADPVLRHSHDIDLLIRPDDLLRAADALRTAGFFPAADRPAGTEPKFDHASGLPVELHSRLFGCPFYRGDLAGLWTRACSAEVAGVPVRRLADIDLLLHALILASLVPQRRGLSWIVDVVTLLHHRASHAIAIDWPGFVRLAGAIGAALPTFVACRYLADTFAAPIPPDALAELQRAACLAGPLQHLAALDGLRTDTRTRALGPILIASSWPSRWAIARAVSFPPPEYLRAAHPSLGRWPLAFLYLKRPLRMAARKARRFRNRLAGFLGSAAPTPSAPIGQDSSPTPGGPLP